MKLNKERFYKNGYANRNVTFTFYYYIKSNGKNHNKYEFNRSEHNDKS